MGPSLYAAGVTLTSQLEKTMHPRSSNVALDCDCVAGPHSTYTVGHLLGLSPWVYGKTELHRGKPGRLRNEPFEYSSFRSGAIFPLALNSPHAFIFLPCSRVQLGNHARASGTFQFLIIILLAPRHPSHSYCCNVCMLDPSII